MTLRNEEKNVCVIAQNPEYQLMNLGHARSHLAAWIPMFDSPEIFPNHRELHSMLYL